LRPGQIAPLMIGENINEVFECDLKGEYITSPRRSSTC